MPGSVAVVDAYSEPKFISSSTEIRFGLKGGWCFFNIIGSTQDILECLWRVGAGPVMPWSSGSACKTDKIPLRMIRGYKSVAEQSSLGLLEDFSIPLDY